MRYMSKIERGIEQRKLYPEEVIALAKEALEQGLLIEVDNDVDRTISSAGVNGENDPRDTKLHPIAGAALADIDRAGHFVGFISNRAADDVAAMAIDAGIKHAVLNCTHGYESKVLDIDHPELNRSVIAERFQPYADTITACLEKLQRTVYRSLKLPYEQNMACNVEIPTRGGPIILQQKGVCPEFPLALANVFNFNLVSPDVRTPIIHALTETYGKYKEQLQHKHPLEAAMLEELWGQSVDDWNPAEPGRFSTAYVPLKQSAKREGLFDLYRVTSQKAAAQGKHIGLIIYGGDDEADAEPMRAAARIASYQNTILQKTNRDLPLLRSVGVWVRPDKDKPHVRQQANIVMNGQEEYAALLAMLAGKVKQYA
jgi:hypothetical protein